MDILKRRQDLINSLTHKEKVAIAISVIEEDRISELKEAINKWTSRYSNIYKIIDIKYSTCTSGYYSTHHHYSAMIIYITNTEYNE